MCEDVIFVHPQIQGPNWEDESKLDQQNKKSFIHLVGVTVEIKVFQEASGELAEQRVVGLINGSQAPVGVVVGAGARTESTHWTGIKTHCGQWHC